MCKCFSDLCGDHIVNYSEIYNKTRMWVNTGRKKSPKKSSSGHHRTTLSRYIFTSEACIDNRKKNLLSSNISSTFPQYRELRPTSSWDRSGSLGHPCKFQRLSLLGSVTARHSSIGRQRNFKLCGVEQRVPPIFGRAAITLGIGPQSSPSIFFFPRLILAVADWMSTILPHMLWP